MNIEENKIFTFKFKFENFNFDLHIHAKDKESAVLQLKKAFTEMLADLNMNFPSKK